MNLQELLSKPIAMMTGEELVRLFSEFLNNVPKETKETSQEDNLINGLGNLAAFLKCSRTQVAKLRNSGKIDSATIQVGRKLLFKKDEVLSILGQEYINN